MSDRLTNEEAGEALTSQPIVDVRFFPAGHDFILADGRRLRYWDAGGWGDHGPEWEWVEDEAISMCWPKRDIFDPLANARAALDIYRRRANRSR